MLSFLNLPFPVLCAESVRDAVGRKVKLSLRKRVKLEIKGDKTENRVLVSQLLLFSSYRFIKEECDLSVFLSHISLLLKCTSFKIKPSVVLTLIFCTEKAVTSLTCTVRIISPCLSQFTQTVIFVKVANQRKKKTRL